MIETAVRRGKGTALREPVYGRKENLLRIARTNILGDFARSNSGGWNHQQWLALCSRLEKDGFVPVDFDLVGLLLEHEKTQFNKSRGEK